MPSPSETPPGARPTLLLVGPSWIGHLAAITGLDWPLGDVGECLVQVGERLESASCAEPHDLQRIAVGHDDVGLRHHEGEVDEDHPQQPLQVDGALAEGALDEHPDEADQRGDRQAGAQPGQEEDQCVE